MPTVAAIDDENAPSRERRQHNGVGRSAKQIADSAGDIGRPWRVVDILASMSGRGLIDKRELMAGEKFHEDFQLAGLDPLRAADMGRIPISGGRSDYRGSIAARGRVIAALDALGGNASPSGSCAWYVLGCELSVRQWCLRGAWSGRPVSQHAASGILIGALGVLAHHWRM